MTTQQNVSPAQELRAAASKIRDTAAKSQAGPWVHHTREYYMLAPAEAHECVRTAADQEYSVVALTGFRNDGIAETRGNAEHIALWHPGVALQVADWLDAEARGIEAALVVVPDVDPEKLVRWPLLIARAINGGA